MQGIKHQGNINKPPETSSKVTVTKRIILLITPHSEVVFFNYMQHLQAFNLHLYNICKY